MVKSTLKVNPLVNKVLNIKITSAIIASVRFRPGPKVFIFASRKDFKIKKNIQSKSVLFDIKSDSEREINHKMKRNVEFGEPPGNQYSKQRHSEIDGRQNALYS